MRRQTSLISILLFFLLFLSIATEALATSSGRVVGSVRDAKTGEPLVGTNVLIVGTSLGAATNREGKFRIPNVPPGSYTLRIRYIGYKSEDVPILVPADGRVTRDVELSYETLEGEAVVVSAQAEGQMAAINQQLTARAIVNVVSSDRIQELPDANAAESVGRLPGVSVLREGGEGQKVVIRGLSPKYNAVMIEGVRMAGTDFDNRSADLSMISPYMLEGIEVMKAITPDQDADVLGGSVNFRMRGAREGFGYDLMAQGGYNGLRGAYDDYKIVGSVNNRFLSSRLGVFAQVDIERRNRSSNEMGAGYALNERQIGIENPVIITALNLKDITRDKERIGGSLVLDYVLLTGEINLKNFLSLADTRIQSRNESYAVDANRHEYAATDARSKLNVMTNVLGYERDIPFGRLDARISHTYSKNKSPRNLTFRFVEYQGMSGVNEKVHPTLLPTYATNRIDETRLTAIDEFDNESRERELTAAADLEMNLRLSNLFTGKLKFGGQHRYKDRSYDHNSAGGQLEQAILQDMRDAILDAFPWMQETVQKGSLNLPLSLFIDHDYDTESFMNGEYEFGPVADIDLMKEIRHYVLDVGKSRAYKRRDKTSTTHDYSGDESSSAGYVMADLNIGPAIKIIPGVRFEHIKTTYTGVRGNSTYPGTQDFYRRHDTTTVRINDHWLPMVHLRYEPLPWFDIRFAYTNTLSRPSYREIIPRYDINTTSVDWHNYRLKPSRSGNFDLYFSVHENHVGLFTLGGFIKRIDDLVFSAGSKIILDPVDFDLAAEHAGKTISTQENNKNRVDLRGLEVDWQTHFWYFPGLFKGVVLNANYTHIFSEAKYPRTIIETEYLFEPPWVIKTNVDTIYTARLLHQPDHIVNVAVGYDFKDFSIRLSMLYQSNIFKGANFWPELRKYTDDYLRWDLSIKQDLPWCGLQLYGNVNNVTSALDRDLNQGTLFPAAEQHYGKTADIGLRWRI